MNYEKHLEELDKFREILSNTISDLEGLGVEFGNYMAQVSGGDGITISHTQGEGSTATITGTAIYNVSGTKLN